MAYQRFADYYDILNADANYDALAGVLLQKLRQYGINIGIVADLGCGTGEVCLRLAKAGYDMIAVDASPEMLNRLSQKLADAGSEGVLLLNQPLEELDLYGTIKAAVSTFDTFNHLPPARLAAVLRQAALFTEPGGLLIFDANTPYKHQSILANNTFEVAPEHAPGLLCEWENHWNEADGRTDITLNLWQNGSHVFCEQFSEYCYTPAQLAAWLREAGYTLLEQLDGESFGPLITTSQRILMVAQKDK